MKLDAFYPECLAQVLRILGRQAFIMNPVALWTLLLLLLFPGAGGGPGTSKGGIELAPLITHSEVKGLVGLSSGMGLV